MQEEIFSKVAELIAANNHIPIDNVTMDSTFESLGMDSLDGLTLINDLENTYDITLPNEDAVKVKTVRDAVMALEFVMAAKKNQPNEQN